MFYVEYGKYGSKLIFSEKDGYVSQFAGSNELEVPFKSEKLSPATAASIQNYNMEDPFHVNGIPSQEKI